MAYIIPNELACIMQRKRIECAIMIELALRGILETVGDKVRCRKGVLNNEDHISSDSFKGNFHQGDNSAFGRAARRILMIWRLSAAIADEARNGRMSGYSIQWRIQNC